MRACLWNWENKPKEQKYDIQRHKMPKCVDDVQNEWGALAVKWSGLKDVEKTLETSQKIKTHALIVTQVNECFS
jgi:hypothetical protein